MTFTHLSIHTQYSFLESSIRIRDLVSRLKQLKMDSIGVTDSGNMFGILEFYPGPTSLTGTFCSGF